MEQCILCGNETDESSEYCSYCGYDISSNTFKDSNLLKSYYRTLKARHWVDGVRFLAHTVKTLRFTVRVAANWFGYSTSHISQDTSLAREIENDPYLAECRTKGEALKVINKRSHPQLFNSENTILQSESDLQKQIPANWSRTPFSPQWNIYHHANSIGHFKAGDAGEIDILARDSGDNGWLVIELKRDQSSDDTIGQILRYMGWVKENLAKEDENVEGIIIAGELDDHLRLALSIVDSVSFYYYSINNDDLILTSQADAKSKLAMKAFDLLTPQEQKDLLKQLQKGIQSSA